MRFMACKNVNEGRKAATINILFVLPLSAIVVGNAGWLGKAMSVMDPSIVSPNTSPDEIFVVVASIVTSPGIFGFIMAALTAALMSTVDTLINAISSLIVVDGKATFNFKKKTNYLVFSKYIIIFLSVVSFIIASKGFDILYLFLLADLFCCAFVVTVFYSFYNKSISEKTAYTSIIIGLIGGFLMFPTPDFSKSLLVGILLPQETFTSFVSQSLLFLSFVVATFLPFIVIKAKKL